MSENLPEMADVRELPLQQPEYWCERNFASAIERFCNIDSICPLGKYAPDRNTAVCFFALVFVRQCMCPYGHARRCLYEIVLNCTLDGLNTFV